jgi:N,N'-diacetyllegionaminate synthase
MEGPDHKASLEPSELKEMVRSIRSIEKALGSFIKEASPSETPNIEVARKSIMTSRAIKKGELFSEDNLTIKRPGNGKSPMLWDAVIGTICARDYEEETLL